MEGTVLHRSDPRRSDVIRILRAAGCVFAEDEADLILAATPDPVARAELVARRASGVPLEYVLGWAEFCGVRMVVADGVFVPRHRTECLVRECLVREGLVREGLAREGLAREATTVAAPESALTIVDLCCGSGAIARILAERFPGARVHAADIDPVAVRCAEANLAPVGGTAHLGDLFAALPVELVGRVDVLVANVPYVPSRAVELLPPEARLYEPRAALDGGPDGLDLLRRVAAGAAEWLTAAGHLLSEIGLDQAGTAEAVLRDAGLRPEVVYHEELESVVIVGRPGPPAGRP